MVRIEQILFTHPSAHGRLGYVYLLAVVNNAHINTRVQVFVWTYVFSSLGCLPRSGTAESYSNSMFNLLGNCQTFFPNQLPHCTSLPAVYEVPVSPSSLFTLVIFCLFYFCHCSGCDLVSHVISICISQVAKDVGHLFMCYCPFVYLLWKKAYLDFCPFLNWVIHLIELLDFFIYSRYKSLITYMIFKYLLHSVGSNSFSLYLPPTPQILEYTSSC